MSSHYGVRYEQGKHSPPAVASVGQQAALHMPSLPQNGAGVSQNPSTIFQQIHELSSKRISTLDYLRKIHNGQVYWYNTLFFTKADVARMSYFETKKLARRATNYLLLGLSLPNVLDPNSSTPIEYLRSLNALLAEFESYQQARSLDGNPSSSLSRAKIPQMFKRATHGGTKGRRSSAAAEIGPPMGHNDQGDGKLGLNTGGAGASTNLTFAAGDQDLLPGEEYNYLLTPTLPFDPDYFETFATLCDILIDCYTRVMALISSPSVVTNGTAEVFAKADARVRKILVAPVVKEFEDASRQGIKNEFGALGKVLVGGLV